MSIALSMDSAIAIVHLMTQSDSHAEKKRVYKIPELARFLGVSPQALHLWMRNGSIRRFKRTSSGGNYLIPRHEVIRLLKRIGREVPGLWTRLRKKVLVIDDYAPIRKLVKVAFRDPTFRLEVKTAASAEDGVFLAATFKPDVIVIDEHLGPDRLKGEQAIELMRKIAGLRRMKLIGMSAYSGARARMAKAGADAFLEKPFGIEDLRQVIYKLAFGNRRMVNTPELCPATVQCFPLLSDKM